MKKTYLFILVWGIIIYSCNKKENISNINEIHYHISPTNKSNFSISEMADSVQFIVLETTPEVLIRQCTKVFFDTPYIIVFDQPSRQVVIFDSEGNFINRIHKVGNGPEEYISMRGFMYDSNKKQIIILDSSSKLLKYDLEGNCIQEITKFNDAILIRKIINLDNGNFLCYTFDYTENIVGKNGSGLWEVDSVGTFIKSHFTYTVIIAVKGYHLHRSIGYHL